jgi:hypothetical protein
MMEVIVSRQPSLLESSMTLNKQVIPSKYSLFQLAPSTPRTEGIGCGLLPTANAQSGGPSSKDTTNPMVNKSGNPLKTTIAMLPTPQTQGLKTCDENGKTQFFKMPMLPTPRSAMASIYPEYGEHWNDKRGGESLATKISQMLPSPMAHEARLGYQDRTTGKKGTQESLTTVVKNETGGKNRGLKLQPAFVEWMMGYPKNYTNLNLPTEWQD